MPIIHSDPDFLAHYGVLGQKWGVRRFQNEDGSLTEAGKAHYRTEKTLPNMYRAGMARGLRGQREAVFFNRGYRQDKKDIKRAYKDAVKGIKRSSAGDERKEQLKSAKDDYKKTKIEARVATAQAIMPYQSEQAHTAVQSMGLAKSIFQNFLRGDRGALEYTKLVASGASKSEAAYKAREIQMQENVLNMPVQMTLQQYRRA